MIHQQDIRRALDMPRHIATDRLVAALDTAQSAPTLSAGKLIKGLKLIATDIDWTTGEGPVVEGTGEALLMVIGGRRGITPELKGTGVAPMDERIGT